MVPVHRVAALISSSASSNPEAEGSAAASSSASLWSIAVPMPHQLLPSPLDEYAARYLLLRDLENADAYLAAAVLLLVALVVVQIRAFSRPPPVPRKRLPARPVLSVLFHPEDDFQQQLQQQQSKKQARQRPSNRDGGRGRGGMPPPGRAGWRLSRVFASRTALPRGKKRGGRGGAGEGETNGALRSSSDRAVEPPQWHILGGRRERSESNELVDWNDDHTEDDDASDDNDGNYRVEVDDDYDYDNGTEEETPTAAHESAAASGAAASSSSPPPPIPSFLNDLPDSFAPLLSSSSMEILANDLVASQLLHALQVDATVRLRQGRHELPLDKDATRPQLGLDVPAAPGGGVKLSATASVGSDQLSAVEDFDVRHPTRMRSQPMVKKASVAMDPPLPLVNVAPTLIHFPTLFEDKTSLPTLRRLPAVRLLMDVVVSMSSFLERCLWIVESKCQIHLSHIRLVPLYKGPRQQPQEQPQSSKPETHGGDGAGGRHRRASAAARVRDSDDATILPSPDWRLQLSFSGHVLLFGWIPIPFINVTLPTWIIPQVRRRMSAYRRRLRHAAH